MHAFTILFCYLLLMVLIIVGIAYISDKDARSFFIKKNSVRVMFGISKIPPWRFKNEVIPFAIVLARHKDIVKVLTFKVRDGVIVGGYKDVYESEYTMKDFLRMYPDKSSMKELKNVMMNEGNALIDNHIKGNIKL